MNTLKSSDSKLKFEDKKVNKVSTSKKPLTKAQKDKSRSIIAKLQARVENRQKRQLKARVSRKLLPVREKFHNIVAFMKDPPYTRKKRSKLTKKAYAEHRKLNRQQQLHGILGIGILFVVVSIAYSTYVIYNGVSSTASRVMLVPQVVFAVFSLLKAFSKIYK